MHLATSFGWPTQHGVSSPGKGGDTYGSVRSGCIGSIAINGMLALDYDGLSNLQNRQKITYTRAPTEAGRGSGFAYVQTTSLAPGGMPMRRNRRRGSTRYQRVKRWAAMVMVVCGAVSLVLAVVSINWGNLSIILFLAGTGLGFLLVGFQQGVDALAAEPDEPRRRP